MSKHIIERWRIPVSRLLLGGLALVVIFGEPRWESIHPFIEIGLFCSGVFLVAIASLGRLWCSLYIAGYKNVHLVTDGPYSICRNPLYFFSFIGGIGIGLATETLSISLLLVIIFAMYYPFVIHKEEGRLLEQHPEAFAAYKKATPAFIPNLSLLKEPETYIVNPVIFKEHIFSALWFIWVVGILEIIEALHETGVIPVVFQIY